MRRPIALACLVVLLIAALAVPAAGAGPATLGPGLWAPCLLLAAILRLRPRRPLAAGTAFGALLPLRGPPTPGRFLDSEFEESLREVSPCAREGWPGS